MTHFVLTTVFLFGALGSALAVLGVNLFRLRAAPGRGIALLYLGVSGATAYSLVAALWSQSSGIACAMPTSRTLLLYGGMTALQLYFLWDSLGGGAKKRLEEEGS